MGGRVQEDLQAFRGGATLIRRAVKKLFRALGIDIRFVPPRGFDAFDDMRALAATDRPLVIDAGANAGQSVERFRRTFARPLIHAFEPSREVFAKLQRNTAGLPDVHCNNLALGPRSESRTFLENDDGEMSSFLEPSRDAWGTISNRYPVDVVTIDDYCAARGIERVDILKIDTQGFDLEVMKGAQAMIGRRAVHLIFTEVIFSDQYKGSARFDQTYAFLADRGFAPVSFYDIYYQHGRAGWMDALFVDDQFARSTGAQ